MAIQRVILHNIEQGRWKEPTPIQMQAIPTLLQRRDLLACVHPLEVENPVPLSFPPYS